MKKVLSILGMCAFGIQSAYAVFDPNWERPIAKADMEVVEGTHNFENVEKAHLVLTRRDGSESQDATGMTLYLKDKDIESSDGGRISPKPRVIQLEIQSQRQDDCGSTVYQAGFHRSGDAPVGARFNLSLVDHSTRICRDHRPHRWEVSVREGYGWCGTSDSILTLAGNPSGIVTIQ